ncbi:hypothetical protein PPL_08047 [Heterostelium album PN500]|uniref:B box-type domain-containing protein n=1 Tax=Heterostelium pallidum (strain ATCC 26659 / Pp 5 / PN500) TaxID=670386 RepID=D3BHP2_HETP5|nr:hypothetical protein PPL_08047 [Heterostelium album PN500]EFA79219.1 hypothetical protein PPL_08047 [Heterostelium album PN500]|eukprot:XP_020431340.1 hypothetical protein PPL_08047 [Heterostelium album PN500]
MTSSCSRHQKSYRFICYQCNQLMCALCITKHNKNHNDHANQLDHIKEIKQSLDNLRSIDVPRQNDNNDDKHEQPTLKKQKLDSIVDNDNKNKKKNKDRKSIWNTLKSDTSRYESLTLTENEITQHFKQLYDYIAMEEYKLKKSIIATKDIIEHQLNNYINELKHLNSIIDLNNNFNNIKQNSNYNSKEVVKNEMKIENTTEQYSLESILKSISSCSTLQSFIDDNNQTLFSNQMIDDHPSVQEQLEQYDNDSLSLLLDTIYKYNDRFQPTATDRITDNTISRLYTQRPDFKQLDSIIQQSITLLTDNTTSYIFSTPSFSGAATLINLSNNNTVEQFSIDFDFSGTYSSIVAVGEYIYVFGGYNDPKKWMKFSIKSKSVEHIGDIVGIDVSCDLSACYDGKDHIYLVGDKQEIDRFNINTMKFEIYHKFTTIKYGKFSQVLSLMIFKGSLYIVGLENNMVFQIDLTRKTLKPHIIGCKPFTACHDDNGNLYTNEYSKKQITKYNVESKQVDTIDIPEIGDELNLMYHRESPFSSFIYSFGGCDCGNFKYSIESNKCEPFFEEDTFCRHISGSVSIKF